MSQGHTAQTTAQAALGPVACGVILSRELSPIIDAYERFLALTVSQRFTLDGLTAKGLGLADLEGHTAAMLAGGSGRDWLLIVEAPEASDRDALGTHGWLAQEVLVEDVDRLAAGLEESPFDVLRPPADLDVSDRIRACQVRGPAGEILYLTQVTGEVPPFELPSCQAFVDHLFIPVLSTPDRDSTLAEYEALASREGLRFDTRITVVNQALGLPLEQRHPVGTLQLDNNALIEVDQIAGTTAPGADLCSGTAAIVFHAAGAPSEEALAVQEGPFAGCYLRPRRGHAGERAALLYGADTAAL